jgi:hypothetical protein
MFRRPLKCSEIVLVQAQLRTKLHFYPRTERPTHEYYTVVLRADKQKERKGRASRRPSQGCVEAMKFSNVARKFRMFTENFECSLKLSNVPASFECSLKYSYVP